MSDRERQDQAKIVIVGIGDDGLAGLTAQARQVIENADVILGAPSTLKLLDSGSFSGRRVELDPDISASLRQTREVLGTARRPAMVNYGDPLFYGIARFLWDRLGKDRFEVLPHVSSMQLAFARIKESWEDAYLASLADKPLETIIERIRTAEKVGLFSSEKHPPHRVAKALLDRGIDYFRAYVCENLGSPDERVTQAELGDLLRMEFHPLHVMVLVRKPNRPDRRRIERKYRVFGNPDDCFAQSLPKRELITTAEVRAMSLSLLDLQPESVVWDIGAGSGSVAIEAARLAPSGIVYAIEPDPTDLVLIQSNCEAFGVENVRAVFGRAPEALAPLPDPDAIFVGGAGRQVAEVLEAAFNRLVPNGRIVVNVATIDGLASAAEAFKRLAGDVSIWSVSIAHGVDQLDRIRFEARNPTFVLMAIKPAGASD